MARARERRDGWDGRRLSIYLAVLLAAMVPAWDAAAQEKSVGFVVGGSLEPFSDLDEDGFLAAPTLTHRLGSNLLLDVGLQFTAVKPRLGGDHVELRPEVGLQLEAHAEAWRPYIGAGIGLSIPFTDQVPIRLAPFVGAGTRLSLGGRISFRVEGRLVYLTGTTGRAIGEARVGLEFSL